MNRVYKVIWSKVRNCYVAVSEIAKNHAKCSIGAGSSVVRGVLAGAVLLSLTAGVCAPVWANVVEGSGTATNGSLGVVVIGDNAKTLSNSHAGIAIGANADVEKLAGIAIGADSVVKDQYGISVGRIAEANGYQSISIGSGSSKDFEGDGIATIADGYQSIAIGAHAKATEDYATVLGTDARVAKGAQFSTAIGHNSSVDGSGLSTVVGEDAHVIGVNNSAFGKSSTVGSGYNANEWRYTTAVNNSSAYGTESHVFGDTSVAIGQNSSVGGYQKWNATDNKWDVVEVSGDTYYKHNNTAVGQNARIYAAQGVALGQGSTAGFLYKRPSTGETYEQTASNATAVGQYARVYAPQGIALGQSSQVGEVRLRYLNNTGKYEYLYPYDGANFPNTESDQNKDKTYTMEVLYAEGGTALGQSSSVKSRDSVAVGQSSRVGNYKTDSTTSEQIQINTQGSTAIGQNSAAYAKFSVALGKDAQVGESGYGTTEAIYPETASGYLNGTPDDAYPDQNAFYSVAIGQNSKVVSSYSIAVGKDSTVTKGSTSSISIGALSKVDGKENTLLGEGSQIAGARTLQNYEYVLNTSGTNRVIEGSNTSSQVGDKNTAVGQASSVSGSNNLALGAGSSVTGKSIVKKRYSIKPDVPQYSYFNANNPFYTYEETIEEASNSTAVGYDSKVYGNNNTALGAGSQVSGAETTGTADGVRAIPGGMKTINAISEGTALGYQSKVTTSGGVALGANSVASRGVETTQGYDVANGGAHTGTRTSTWAPTAAAVSVGDSSNNITRRITGVAAGSQDTDAVNVAQLRTATAGSAIHYFSVNDTGSYRNDDGSGNYNNRSATGINSMAVGQNAKARGGFNNVAVGTNSVAGNISMYSSVNARQKALSDKIFDFYGSVGNAGNELSRLQREEGLTEEEARREMEFQVWMSDGDTYPDTFGFPSDDNSTAVGYNAKAPGPGQTAIGAEAWATGRHSTAIGIGSRAKGNASVAIGKGAVTSNYDTNAIGVGSYASGLWSSAIGQHAKSETPGSIAIGLMAEVRDTDWSHRVPDSRNNKENPDDPNNVYHYFPATNSIAVGTSAIAEAIDTTAIGRQSQALMPTSTAYGNNSHANGDVSIAIGNKATAGLQTDIFNFDYSDTLNPDGSRTKIRTSVKDSSAGSNTIAIGNRATAIDKSDIAIGVSAYTDGGASVSIGDQSRATGKNSIAIGGGSAYYQIMGDDDQPEVGNPHTENARYYGIATTNQASGDYSTAAGYNNKTVGEASSALGKENAVTGTGSLAAGSGNKIGSVKYVDLKTEIPGTNISLVPADYPGGKDKYEEDAAAGKITGLVAEEQENTVTGYAVGTDNTITGTVNSNAGAFGAENTIAGDNSYAAGNSNTITKNSANSFVVGNNITTTAPNTVVFGHHTAENTHTFGQNSVSLGFDAVATEDGSVALGSESIATRKAGVTGVNPLNVPVTVQQLASPAWTSTDAAVSVGGGTYEYKYPKTNEKGQYVNANGGVVDKPEDAEQLTDTATRTRQITNVAAGTKPTDAVNVAQLEGFATHYYSVNTDNTVSDADDGDKPDGEDSNYDNLGATGKRALAAGYYTSAVGNESTALGNKSLAEGANSVATGYKANAQGENSVALGVKAEAFGESSSAMGIDSTAVGRGGLAIGHGSSTGVKADINEGGADDFWTTEVNVNIDEQTGKPTGDIKDGGIAIGSYAHTEGTRALAVGRVASAYGENSTAMGLRSSAYGEGSMAFGHGVVAGDKDDAYATQVKELHENPNSPYDLDGERSKLVDAKGNAILDKDGNEQYIEVDPNNTIGAVAMGSYAEATGRGSLSVGRYSKAESAYTTAMGIRADAGENSENAIAIGRETKVTAFETDKDGNIKLDEKGNPKPKAYGGANSIAMGTMASVNGQNSIAIGTTDMIKDGKVVKPEERKATSVTGDSSIAIGKADTIEGDSSIAIGTGHVVKGNNSGAFGDPNVVVGNSSYILGNSSEIGSVKTEATTEAKEEIAVNNAFIIGNNSKIASEDAEGGLIFGSDAKVDAKNGSALGNGTSVTVADAVALGSTSVAKRTVNNGRGANDKTNTGFDVTTGENYVLKEGDNSATWLSTLGAVSVGGTEKDTDAAIGTAATQTRQITGVAAGTADTDAVNVAQLRLAMGAKNYTAGDNVHIDENNKITADDTTYTFNDTTQDAQEENPAIVQQTTVIQNNPDGTTQTVATLSDTDTTYNFDKTDKDLPEGQVSKLTITNNVTGKTTEFVDTDTNTHASVKGKGAITVEKTKEATETAGPEYTVSLNTELLGDTTYTAEQSVKAGGPGEGSTTFNITDSNGDSAGTMTVQAGDNVTITEEKDENNKPIAVINATNTTYEISTSAGEELGPNVVNQYTLKGSDGKEYPFADTDTKYTAAQSVEAGNDWGEGSSTFTITDNSGNDLAPMTVKAGNNVKITKGENGEAVIHGNGLDNKSYAVDENGEVTFYDQAGNHTTITGLNPNNDGAITRLGDQITRLGDRIDKVGAGAAALAGLHPLDFDPDEKWDFSAAAGSYRGEHAVAIGAFYRPNEDTMFSVGGTIGNGNNMVNVGVSWKFGQKNRISANRISSAKEIIELRKNQEDVHSFLADAVAGNQLDLSKIQLFPDVEENHWAYDYVATMAGNGILEGYPDGYFKGNRNMTRYEMAAVLYRLMQNGARLSDRALTEFAPELDRIRVDTITKHKDGTPHIQRVRTIKERVDEKADPSSEKTAKKKAKVKVAEKPVE